MDFERLEIERDGPLLRVWLCRPERRNALDTAALEEIARLFDSLGEDFAPRVVVLGGRGASFCAGADRQDPPGRSRTAGRSDVTERERRWLFQIGRRACRAIEDCEVPTLARVHGHAIGGGFLLALACDLRIAVADTVFQVPEVALGLPLTWGGAARLVSEVGAARAREIILLGERFDGTRAEAWGVVHRAVPAAALDDAVDAWAQRLAAQPELAVHATRTRFRAHAAAARLGDVTEDDADALAVAARSLVARTSFGEE